MRQGRSEGAGAADLGWCYDAVDDVSRTFAITIDELDPPVADAICVGYLLCRVPDTIEDTRRVPPEEKVALLETYGDALDPDDETTIEAFVDDATPFAPDDPTPHWEVVVEAGRIVDTYRSLPDETRTCLLGPIRELVGGMATYVDRYADTGGLRIETVEELEDYCWYAAGTVGTLMTNLLARGADEETRGVMCDTARSFGLLLQLVNIAKDVAADYHEENNVYLPADWLREVGVSQEAVAEADNAPAVAGVIGRVVDRATGYLDDAQAWLEVVPERDGNTLAACAIPFMLAVATLRELDRRPEDVIREGGLKIERSEVYAIISRFHEGVARDELGSLRERIAAEPLHR